LVINLEWENGFRITTVGWKVGWEKKKKTKNKKKKTKKKKEKKNKHKQFFRGGVF